MRGCVKEELALFRRFHIGRHMRMEHQVEAELSRHLFSICHDSSYVPPLFRRQLGTVFVIGASGKRVSLVRLIIGDNEEWSFEGRQQMTDLTDAFDRGVACARIRHFHWNERSKQLQFSLFE